MAKFTTQDLLEFKQVKPALTKQFKKVLQSLPPATTKFWNNDRKLLELNNFKYSIQDLQNLLKEIQRVYMQLYVEAAENSIWVKGQLSEKKIKARPGTKPVRRTTKPTKLAERKNVVIFPDGFEFKKVSPVYAKKNYKTEMIYGLDPNEGVEGLIETIQDFNYWQNATNIFGKEY